MTGALMMELDLALLGIASELLIILQTLRIERQYQHETRNLIAHKVRSECDTQSNYNNYSYVCGC